MSSSSSSSSSPPSLRTPLLLCLPCGCNRVPDAYYVCRPNFTRRVRYSLLHRPDGSSRSSCSIFRLGMLLLTTVAVLLSLAGRAVPHVVRGAVRLRLGLVALASPPSLSLCVTATADDLNRGSLARLVRSVRSQTDRPDEVVLTLTAYGIACRTARRQVPKSWTVQCLPAQRSRVEARAVAAGRASGDVVSFFDAVDGMNPRRIELLRKLFRSGGPELRMVTHGTASIRSARDKAADEEDGGGGMVDLTGVALPLDPKYTVGGADLYRMAAEEAFVLDYDSFAGGSTVMGVDGDNNPFRMQHSHVTVRKELLEAVPFRYRCRHVDGKDDKDDRDDGEEDEEQKQKREKEEDASGCYDVEEDGDEEDNESSSREDPSSRAQEEFQFVRDAILNLGPTDKAMMLVKLPLSVHVPTVHVARMLELELGQEEQRQDSNGGRGEVALRGTSGSGPGGTTR